MTNIVTLLRVSEQKSKPQDGGQKTAKRLDEVIAMPCIDIEMIANKTCELIDRQPCNIMGDMKQLLVLACIL